MVQDAHISWSGNGEYQLVGNYQARGRKWNEPFPSDLHLLANEHLSDVSSCGKSGRWICDSVTVADLRSGDAMKLALPPSDIAFPKGADDVSEITDSDAKGSPDGTKLCFVHTLDLAKSNYTQLRNSYASGDALFVMSTDGFPYSGELEIKGEVIGYTSKSDTAFMGIVRGKYRTPKHRVLGIGWQVVAFKDRVISPKHRNRAIFPGWWEKYMAEFKGQDLYWQRQTDLYVMAIREPDPPHLRINGGNVELIPGENHRETMGYIVLRDGKRLNQKPIGPGGRLDLPDAGIYTAYAVEWSGLSGKYSVPLHLKGKSRLQFLMEKPEDFSWTSEVWFVEGREVTKEKAMKHPHAVLKVRHLHDGVIKRITYKQGAIIDVHDYNSKGLATRQLTYKSGKLHKREYFNKDGRVSMELFGENGFKTDEYRYVNSSGKEYEKHHWEYSEGWPMRYVYKRGKRVFAKRGDRWLSIK
jgi:hypothetical protein